MSGPADASEMGRELRASELRERMIVFILPPQPAEAPPVAFTLWVGSVTDRMVVFFSGVERITVVNFKTPEDGLVDGRGRQVRVFEYLGDP